MRADPREVRALVHALDRSGEFPLPPGELSVAFLDAPEMARLHERFMADPTPTDVITFDGDPSLGAAGEICVCPAVAREYAQAHGGAWAHELALYIVHGCLHLAGFDDRRAADQRRMRAAEIRAMDLVRTAQALPRFSLAGGR